MFHVLETNQHFHEYYNHYINKDWKSEYFAYDHFKTVCKTIKSNNKQLSKDASKHMLVDLQRRCHEEIKKVHRFIVNMILTIDLDLQTINEMLESEGIRVKKPSEMRTVMARKASNASLIYDDHLHIARQSSIVFSSSADQSLKDDFKSNGFFGRFQFITKTANWKLLTSPIKTTKSHGEDKDYGYQQAIDIEEGAVMDPTTEQRNAMMKLGPDSGYRDRSIELSLRNVYNRIKQLEQFYHLNFYIIRKISKKIDKLLKDHHDEKHRGKNQKDAEPQTTHNSKDHHTAVQRSSKSNSDSSKSNSDKTKEHDNQASSNKDMNHEVHGNESHSTPHVVKQHRQVWHTWKETRCGRYFYKEFVTSKNVIEEIKDECVSLYAKKFRKSYTELATYELEYIKEKDHMNSSTKLFVGWKFGLIVSMVSTRCITVNRLLTCCYSFRWYGF